MVKINTGYDFNAASFGTQELFIGISGIIGAGKTTLAENIAAKLGLPVHYEPVIDNVYLEDFYGDMVSGLTWASWGN